MHDRRRILAAAAGALCGCGRKTAAPAGPFRLALTRQPSMAGVYTAIEKGYFKDAGTPVDPRPIGMTTEAVPLLAGGKFDVCFGALCAAIFNAVEKGSPVRICAGREVVRPGCSDFGVIYGRREAFPRGLADLRQLKGKRVATGGAANLNNFVLDVMLEAVGLTMNDVTLHYLGTQEAIAAMQAKHVDAWVAVHVYGPTIAERFPDWQRHPGLGSIQPGFQLTQVLYGPRLLQGPVEQGGRVMAAYLRGVGDYARGYTPKFLDDMARSNGIEPEAARRFCREVSVEDGEVVLDSLRFYNQWAVRRRLVPRVLRPEELIDTRFLEYARAHPMPGRG
ncbi:MAG: hypothetical protein FJW34_10610 [Acidobacteria bacterium]|nr:hypothetical protein [Acidobacteriota bacterium]